MDQFGLATWSATGVKELDPSSFTMRVAFSSLVYFAPGTAGGLRGNVRTDRRRPRGQLTCRVSQRSSQLAGAFSRRQRFQQSSAACVAVSKLVLGWNGWACLAIAQLADGEVGRSQKEDREGDETHGWCVLGYSGLKTVECELVTDGLCRLRGSDLIYKTRIYVCVHCWVLFLA